ncbi:MAG TPA: hypothetical protein VGC74_08480 [Stenotrophomonas sp.]|jgi:hypothetical protein
MEQRLLLYDVEGRGLALPPGWHVSQAGDRRWLARGELLIPLPTSLNQMPSRLSAIELDALHYAIPGAHWRDAPPHHPHVESATGGFQR